MMTYQDIKKQILDSINLSSDYDWMVYVVLLVTATAMASYVVEIMLNKVARKLASNNTKWDDVVIDSAVKPLKLYVWIVGVSEATKVAMDRSVLDVNIADHVVQFREIAIVLAIAWWLMRLIRRGRAYFISSRHERGDNVDLTAVQAVSNLLNISVIISTMLICLQNFGVSISGLLAFGGVGGLAVGFAAKDMLANFFGALIIFFDKPFKVGDWIRSPDQDIEGHVREIGWRMTTIETFDKRPLYVPNSVFANISVENPSRMTHRRIYETVGIRYDDIGVMSSIVNDVRDMLQTHAEIDEKQTLIVNFNAFNSSSCDFMVYTFTHTRDWIKFHNIKQEVLLAIAEIIDTHGAEIAYPTQVEYLVEKSFSKERDDTPKKPPVKTVTHDELTSKAGKPAPRRRAKTVTAGSDDDGATD